MPPFRILILCTGNSARSQIAEALINSKAAGRFVATSAGSAPAAEVNPWAIAVLRKPGLNGTATHRKVSLASNDSVGIL